MGISLDDTYVWVANYRDYVTRIIKSDSSTTTINTVFSNPGPCLGDMTGYAYDYFF